MISSIITADKEEALLGRTLTALHDARRRGGDLSSSSASVVQSKP